MTDSTEVGLRERKRRETRRSLQVAILQQALERGYDRVTIEDVCRAAYVSPRTFFNYFASKEDAVLGAAPGFPDESVLERYVAGGFGSDALRDLPELFLSMSDRIEDIDILTLRKRLLRQEPGLLGLRVSSGRAFENSLTEVVQRRMAREDPGADEAAVQRSARLIALVGFAAIRHGWLAWIDASGAVPLEIQLRQSFAELESVVSGRTSADSLVEEVSESVGAPAIG